MVASCEIIKPLNCTLYVGDLMVCEFYFNFFKKATIPSKCHLCEVKGTFAKCHLCEERAHKTLLTLESQECNLVNTDIHTFEIKCRNKSEVTLRQV